MRTFLDLPKRGKHQWWRYILSIALVLFFWLILGSVPFLGVALWMAVDNNPATGINPEDGTLTGFDPILTDYLLPNLAFPLFLLGLFLAVRLVHKRRLQTLITPQARVSLGRILQGFSLWLALAGVMALVEYLMYPGAFTWVGVAPGRYLGFMVLALGLTTLQASTEELFFRGYLLQGMGHWMRRPLPLAALNGVLFMLPHVLNPEVQRGGLLMLVLYWGIGAFFAWITLQDEGLELALGAHAANNLFVALFVNFESSALQTPALIQSNRFDPLFNLVTLVIMVGVFQLIVFRRTRPRSEKRPR